MQNTALRLSMAPKTPARACCPGGTSRGLTFCHAENAEEGQQLSGHGGVCTVQGEHAGPVEGGSSLSAASLR